MSPTENVLTLAEKGTLSATIVITGFVVVFSVLLLLIAFIVIYGKIVNGVVNASNKKKEKAQKTAQAEKVEEKPVAQPVVSQTNGISDEVVAVISAAVASMYGSNEKIKIKSIKKAKGVRSAWSNAGVVNNTRPF